MRKEPVSPGHGGDGGTASICGSSSSSSMYLRF